MEAQREEQRPTYDELLAQNHRLSEENARIWQQLLELKRHVFGRRSEKLAVVDERQELLFSSGAPQIEPAVAETEVSSHIRRKNGGRKPLPAELPRERVEYEPEVKHCACCGELMPRIGEEKTDELEYVPARFFVREHVKIKRACSRCKQGVGIGKLPPEAQIIERGRPGAGLLAHIFISKYCDHLPLHRQEQIFERHGIELPRQRMCDWIGKLCEELLIPISLAQKREILKSRYIRADETTLKVQDPNKAGKLHTGYLWGMLSLEGDVYFEYSPSRAGAVAERLFDGCDGFIQTDLYAGYNPVFVPDGAVRVGCWDHVRRKFIAVQKVAQKECGRILKLISELYRLERKLKQLSIEEKVAARQKKSKPIIETLERFLRELQQRLLPKAPLREAVDYALCQWDALVLFLEHAELELGNIAIEQQIRPIAVGRHNWLFAGSDRGARWTACMYSLIGTCKRNGINPFDYLQDVLRRGHTVPASRLWELTPRGWNETRG